MQHAAPGHAPGVHEQGSCHSTCSQRAPTPLPALQVTPLAGDRAHQAAAAAAGAARWRGCRRPRPRRSPRPPRRPAWRRPPARRPPRPRRSRRCAGTRPPSRCAAGPAPAARRSARLRPAPAPARAPVRRAARLWTPLGTAAVRQARPAATVTSRTARAPDTRHGAGRAPLQGGGQSRAAEPGPARTVPADSTACCVRARSACVSHAGCDPGPGCSIREAERETPQPWAAPQHLLLRRRGEGHWRER